MDRRFHRFLSVSQIISFPSSDRAEQRVLASPRVWITRIEVRHVRRCQPPVLISHLRNSCNQINSVWREVDLHTFVVFALHSQPFGQRYCCLTKIFLGCLDSGNTRSPNSSEYFSLVFYSENQNTSLTCTDTFNQS